MAISISSGFPGSAQASTLSVTTANVGDLIVALIVNQVVGSSVSSMSDSNSRISWQGTYTQLYSNTTPPAMVDLWYGTVTSVGSTTVQPTWSGTLSGPEVNIYEFHDSSSGSWSLVTSNTSTNGTTVTWPSLTSSSTIADQLYVGYAVFTNNPITGSTSGFTYVTTADTNLMLSDVSLATNTAYAPTASANTGNTYNVAAIFGYTPNSATWSSSWYKWA